MALKQRTQLLLSLADQTKIWDIIIIGGGATGLGAALDAASRGYATLLLEQSDFAKGTSSRSTKLVHGGVRYLAQGDISLVHEALFERGVLLKNAPHLVKEQTFVIPNYNWWGSLLYTAGLVVYDLLAGKFGLGKTKHINRSQVIKQLPAINQTDLQGGVIYYDAQFDDARLAVNLAQTCLEQGATVLNYVKVVDLVKNAFNKVDGVVATDIETGNQFQIKGKVVINATGIFVDDILKMNNPQAKPIVKPSQGVHIVIDRSFLPGKDALMIPKTDDGRVLFAVLWHDKVIVGTTDTPLEKGSLEPSALPEEIDFILKTLSKYLVKSPQKSDVLSVFTGLRPLAAPTNGSSKTKEISRSHKIIVSDSNLVTITGGKWTTYRKMGEDVINKAITVGQLKPVTCITQNLSIHGSHHNQTGDHLAIYGSDRAAILKLSDSNPAWAAQLHSNFPYTKAEVIWAVRNEMALTVEDVLARRLRVLFLDAQAAVDMAPLVAELMAIELAKSISWKERQVERFIKLAQNYLLIPYQPVY